jgi:hypothetical protein
MDSSCKEVPEPPDWDPSMAKWKPKVAVTAKNVDEFIDWAGSAPMSEVDALRAATAEGCNDDVVAILGSELNTLPIIDRSRHSVLLSILGESRRETAVVPLERFIWNIVDVLPPVEITPVSMIPHQVVCDFGIDFGHAFRARAVEMLTYIGTARAIEGAVRVIREHPEADVRRAAIDAYIYNHGDSPEAIREVSAFVCAEDREWIGIPRRTLETDEDDLRERIARLTEPAPTPTHVPRPVAPADSARREHVSTKPPEV